MKHRSGVGCWSLVGVCVLAACSNDGLSTPVGDGGSSGSNSAGSGGTAGTASSAGNAGMGGTMMSNAGTGGTAMAGSAGSGGAGGTGPDVEELDPPDCSGCIELRVPVTGASQHTYFNLQLPGARDFSAGKIIYRMQVLTFDGSFIAEAFLNQSDFAALEFADPLVLSEDVESNEELPPADPDAGVVTDASAPVDDGFFNFVFDVGAFDANFIDKTDIVLFGLRVGTNGAYAGGPTTVRVVLDSIRFEGVTGVSDLEFTGSNQNFVVNTFVDRTPDSEVIHYP